MDQAQILDRILIAEGGFVDNPADRGGPTNMGITQTTLAEFRGHPVTREDVQALTEPEAREIYRRRYIEGPGFEAIVSGDLRWVVVDAGVNHGPSTAIKLLQRALGAKPDGILGPVTLTATNAWEGRVAALRFLAQRVMLYGRLISKNLTDADKDGIPDNTEFAAGWLNRVGRQIEALA